MKRLNIRKLENIETVESLGAPSPFYVSSDGWTFFYDPAREALVRLTGDLGFYDSTWFRDICGEGKYVLCYRPASDSDPLPFHGPTIRRTVPFLRNLLTGEITEFPPFVHSGNPNGYTLSTDMQDLYFIKKWSEKIDNPYFAKTYGNRMAYTEEQHQDMAHGAHVHTALLKFNLASQKIDVIKRLPGSSAMKPLIAINPQATQLITELPPNFQNPKSRAWSYVFDLEKRSHYLSLQRITYTATAIWDTTGTKANFLDVDQNGLAQIDTVERVIQYYNLNKGLHHPGVGFKDGAMFFHGTAEDGRVYASGEKRNTLIIQLIDPATNEREEIFRMTDDEIKYATFAQNTKDFYLRPIT